MHRHPSPAEIPRAHLPLCQALRWGTLAAVEMLLDAGANPNGTRSDWSGLQWPARTGNLLRAKFLMDRGADLQSQCAARSLRHAARECQPAMVELLVTHGVDVHATDEDGRTALDKNRWEVAEMLLDRGADIDRQVGWYALTALHQAVGRQSVETVRLLLSRGADVTLRTRSHHLPTPLQGNGPPTVSRDEIRKLLIAHGAKPEEQPPHTAEVH